MTVDRTSENRPTEGEKPLLLVFAEPGRNRELLVDTLGDEYHVKTATDPSALDGTFDCCLLTQAVFPDISKRIDRRRAETPAFLPFVLLAENSDVDTAVWEYVDDVVALPVKKEVLHARVQNLVERHRTARKLTERDRELEATIADLQLKERAIDEAPVGFTVADATAGDDPLVYVNDQFLRVTGYSRDEVLGRNCRFLQGEETNQGTVATLREALADERPVSVDIVNYRKHGQKFWNHVDIIPLRNGDGDVTHFAGFQSDITERKVKQRRHEVLNRVLSHNLRNKMNVIEAYLELLRQDANDEPREELDRMADAVENLLALAETARETDRILSQTNADDTLGHVDERLQQLVDSVRDRYPEVTIDLTLPAAPIAPLATGGLLAALEEALDNAAKHNDNPDAAVSIRVTNRGERWVDIEIEDNGPGIPEQELAVLDHGEEALRHADRMGIWLIYWTVSRAGGTMTVTESDDGTAITLSVPTAEQ